MSFNWDNIKYMFQIPWEWFKAIHNRVFGMYGTNFIVIREDEDGATQVDVDQDSFTRAVLNIAGGGVKSVDGTYPDDNGNVELSSYVESVDGIEPDDDGNVELSGYVKSVDDIEPDDDGNVELTGYVKSVNGETPDQYGEVSVYVGVETVNNISPDANGNVNINADTSQCLMLSDWMSTTSTHNVCPYYYANIAYTGNLPNAVTQLYQWVGATAYQTMDDAIYDLGYVKDADLTDYALTSDLGELAYMDEDDLGDLAFMDSVTVDGHASDANGEVSFGLAANKYLKSDAQGHITTTNDTPIAIDTSQYTPVNVSNQKVITNVTWNGTTLKYSSQNWTFVNGVLVQKTNNTDTTIDTPTVVTWA